MGAFLMVLSILLGLICFILSLIAEATHSQVILSGKGGGRNECTYSGSGKTPLLCASAAFLALDIAMVIGILILILSTLLFGKLRVSFAVAEILLLIGLSVESGHLQNWEIAKESCLVVGQGLFSAAGVFGILSTDSFLGGWFIHDSTKSTKTIVSSRKYKC